MFLRGFLNAEMKQSSEESQTDVTRTTYVLEHLSLYET